MVSFIKILNNMAIVLLQVYDVIYSQICSDITLIYVLKGSKTDRYYVQ
jgi:hypothetical protein